MCLGSGHIEASLLEIIHALLSFRLMVELGIRLPSHVASWVRTLLVSRLGVEPRSGTCVSRRHSCGGELESLPLWCLINAPSSINQRLVCTRFWSLPWNKLNIHISLRKYYVLSVINQNQIVYRALEHRSEARILLLYTCTGWVASNWPSGMISIFIWKS